MWYLTREVTTVSSYLLLRKLDLQPPDAMPAFGFSSAWCIFRAILAARVLSWLWTFIRHSFTHSLGRAWSLAIPWHSPLRFKCNFGTIMQLPLRWWGYKRVYFLIDKHQCNLLYLLYQVRRLHSCSKIELASRNYAQNWVGVCGGRARPFQTSCKTRHLHTWLRTVFSRGQSSVCPPLIF